MLLVLLQLKKTYVILCSEFSTITNDGPVPLKPENFPKATEEALEFIETVGKRMNL